MSASQLEATTGSEIPGSLMVPQEGIIRLHQFVINLRYLVSAQPDEKDPTRLTLYFADGHSVPLNRQASAKVIEYFTNTVGDSLLR